MERLCVKCKHFKLKRIFFIPHPEFSKCARLRSPVDGSPYRYCETERRQCGECGPPGKYWEAK